MLDLKATMRGLKRRPAFTMAAVATIALAIAASTAMFSAVDAILIRALPYATPERLVAMLPGTFVANRELEQMRTRLQTADQVAVFSPGWLMPLVGLDAPLQVNAARVSGNLFSMVGTRPALGHAFDMEAEVPGNTRVAVLGHELWLDVFHGDPAIVGRSIDLEGAKYTVVAVMPRGFQLFDHESDLWVPMSMSREAFTWSGSTSFLYARLRTGRTLADLEAEMRTVVPSIAAQFSLPNTWGGPVMAVGLQESMVGNVSRMLWLLFGAVVFVLAIATGNVANLLLVRASERRAELALRTSLGAPQGRIARLLLGESLVLGLTGGAIGVGLAAVAVRALPSVLPSDLPRLGEVALNGRILAFAFLATLVPSLAFGLAPVLQTWKTGLSAMLREARTGGVRGERVRGSLVSLQVAMALVLLVGASIMGRSLVALLKVDRGLRSDHLLTATVMPGMGDPETVRAFWRQSLRGIEGIPGVSAAGTILHLPTIGRTWMADIEVDGRELPADQPKPRSAWQSVSTNYFATAGVPVVQGRPFATTDNAAAPRVAAVNTAFAAKFFPGQSPIGHQITAGNATRRERATIVAVVGGVRHDSLSAAPAPEIYVPIEQNVVYATGLLVRTSGDPLAIARAVRERIWAVNPNVPISNVRSMDDLFSSSLQRPRLILGVLAFFAGVGLVLGAVGIYGVVAYGVQQRLRELGIRAALGADVSALRRLVVRGGLRFAMLGVVVGVPVALGLSRTLRGVAFGVPSADPISFLAVPVVLVGVAALASWFPARRASRADPMSVLREE